MKVKPDWKIIAVSEASDFEFFFTAGEKLREGPSVLNRPSAGYSRLVWSSVDASHRQAWLAVKSESMGSAPLILGRVAAFIATPQPGAVRTDTHKPWGAIGLYEVQAAGVGQSSRRRDAVAQGLLEAASEWLAEQGVGEVYGPLDASTWFQYRLREYDRFPSVRNFAWEPTTPAEYLEDFKQAGWKEAERYHSYGYDLNERYTLADAAKLLEPASAFAASKGFRIEPLLREGESLSQLLSRLYPLSARCFEENFLYTPISEPLFKQLYSFLEAAEKAGQGALKQALRFSFRVVLPAAGAPSLGSEKEGGFLFCFPDQNAIVVKSLGILPEYRKLHLSNALLHQAILRASQEPGFDRFISALVKAGSTSEFIERKHFQSPIEMWHQDYVLMSRTLKPRAMRRAPGPRGREVLKHLLRRRKNPIDFYVQLRKEYGRLVELPVGPLSFFMVSDPEAIKQVLLDRHRDYVKGPGFERLGLVLGQGLITSEGDVWKKQRKLIQPSLSREKLSVFSQQLGEITQRFCEAWEARLADAPEGRLEVDLSRAMMDLSLELVSETLLGSDMRPQAQQIGKAFQQILDHWERLQVAPSRLLELVPKKIAAQGWFRGLRGGLRRFPSRETRAFERAIEDLNQVVHQVIETAQARMSRGEPGKGLVSALLQARDEETGEGMSAEQLRDEVMTFLLAGHETTANGLFWAHVLLTQNPGAAAKIHDEAKAVWTSFAKEGGFKTTLEKVAQLKWTQAVFEESLRLHPPVWRMTRQASRDDELLGYRVPEGSLILITPYLVHRDPEFWGEDADQFRPERFSRESKRNRFAYLPFGAGPRMCIGSHFAILEAQIVLSFLYRRFEIRVLETESIPLSPRITLRPKGVIAAEVRRARP